MKKGEIQINKKSQKLSVCNTLTAVKLRLNDAEEGITSYGFAAMLIRGHPEMTSTKRESIIKILICV